MGIPELEAQKTRIINTLTNLFELYRDIWENVDDYESGFDYDDEIFQKFQFGYDETDELDESLRILLQKVEKVFSSTLSHVHGLSKEADSALQHASKANRHLIPGVGDIGVWAPYGGKAIQQKFTSTERYADVDKHLKKALLQLTGAKGEVPRDDHNRVAEIAIDRRDNSWPYTQAQAFAPALNTFLGNVRNRVHTQFVAMYASAFATKPAFTAWFTQPPLPPASTVITVQDYQRAHFDEEGDYPYPSASWVVSTMNGPEAPPVRLRQILVKLQFRNGVSVNCQTVPFAPPFLRDISRVVVALYLVQPALPGGSPTIVSRVTKSIFR